MWKWVYHLVSRKNDCRRIKKVCRLLCTPFCTLNHNCNFQYASRCVHLYSLRFVSHRLFTKVNMQFFVTIFITWYTASRPSEDQAVEKSTLRVIIFTPRSPLCAKSCKLKTSAPKKQGF